MKISLHIASLLLALLIPRAGAADFTTVDVQTSQATILCARQDRGHRSCCCNRQLALGGLRFFSTSASVIIIIIGSTGHS